jgi:hypothetical protein
VIGHLTDEQLATLNAERAQRNFPAMNAAVVFIGSHIYKSRVERDGYTFDDVIQQIRTGMDEKSKFHANPKMNALVSSEERDDGYGNRVIDNAVFECTVRFPRPELYSVIPKGDKIKPRDAKKSMGRDETAHTQNSADPSG